MITLTPEPATYASAQAITLTLSPEFSSVIITTDGTSPTLAKYIAYDTLSTPNPFIAVVQDGRGNALFDGGFPKWYNNLANTAWAEFSQLPAAFKYMVNALGFISNPDKTAQGNKKILFIGDADVGQPYNLKGTDINEFKTSFDVICGIAGYTPTYKTKSDWGGVIDVSYPELDQYCAVVLLSSVYATTKLISDMSVSNISAYREAGNGVFIITDHGVGADGFYKTANYVAANLGVSFDGNYDRVPVNVGFLRSTYGDHPLYKNLSNDEFIAAGGSESKVIVTPSTTYTSANLPIVNTTNSGLFTIRCLLQRPDGTIATTSSTYAININAPAVFVSDYAGSTVVTTLQPRYSRTYDVYIALDNSGFGETATLSGLIKHNSEVLCGFMGTTGAPMYAFSGAGNNTIQLASGINSLEIELQMPVKFFKTLTVEAVREDLPLSMSRLIKQINRYDLTTANPKQVLRTASAKLNADNRLAISSTIKGVRAKLQ